MNTIAAYRRDLTRFSQWLAGRSIAKLTVRNLSDYMAWLQTQKLAATSIARHMVAVKLLFRYLQLEGVVRDNPAELLGSQKTWQRVPEVMSAAMVERLLTAPQAYDAYWQRDRALLELLYATGCRASEVSNLTLADVHLNERFCLAHGKGSKDRLTPLGGAAVIAIRDYLKEERPKLAKGRSDPPWLLSARRETPAPRGDLGVSQAVRAADGAQPRCESAHAAAQLCHAPPGGRRRLTASARAARPRQHRHDADLHARRSDAAQARSPAVSSRGRETSKDNLIEGRMRNFILHPFDATSLLPGRGELDLFDELDDLTVGCHGSPRRR